jgi:acyl-CoA synthetase (NDP forming)
LDKYFKWGKLRVSLREEEMGINKTRQSKASKILQKAKKSGRGALLFQEAKEMMKLYRIKTIAYKDAEKGEKTNEHISFPAVVKVDSDKILHKTDKQAIILDIKDEKELQIAVNKLEEDFPEENIIIQPMLPRQAELIIGVKNDPTAGPVIAYGLGGIYTEIFRRVNFLIPPISPDEIKESLINGNLGFLFKETRGLKPYNIRTLAEILRNISELSLEVGEIKELDINPLLIYNDGKEEIAVDIKVII